MSLSCSVHSPYLAFADILDKKKETHTVCFFFWFSEFDQIFQLFHLYSSVAKLGISVCRKIYPIRSKSESVIRLEIREG